MMNEPPRGIYEAHIDDKGRLKLPTEVYAYLNHGDDRKLFVTSLDNGRVRIYPESEWRQFETHARDLPGADNIAFHAVAVGAETEADARGRVLVPAGLRRELGMENSTVCIYARRDHFEVCTETDYGEQVKQATSGITSSKLPRKGLR